MIDQPETTAERKLKETWLRANGLPLLVLARHRASRALWASTPLLVGLIVAAIATTLFDHQLSFVIVQADGEFYFTDQQAFALLIPIGIFVASIPVGLVAAFVLRHFKKRFYVIIVASVAVFVWLVGLGVFDRIYTGSIGIRTDSFERFGILLCIYLIFFFEIPSIGKWAIVRAFKSLGTLVPMISRVLPFLLLAQLLVFFTNEIWQLSYSLSKTRMWALSGVLVIPIIVIVVAVALDSLNDELRDPSIFTGDLLDGTPWAGKDASQLGAKLTFTECANLVLIPVVAQLVQILLFLTLILVFFISLGQMAVLPSLVQTWTGYPSSPMMWLGFQIPIDKTMFRVALILAIFSGLSFAASSVTDPQYRKLFIEPILAELRRNLAVRNAYSREP